MPTVADITKEIKANKDEILATKEKIMDCNGAIMNAWESKQDRTKLHAEELMLETKVKFLNVKHKVLIQNRYSAIYEEVLPVLIEEFNKYKGKPYGAKTREKIAVAINNRTGFRVFIDTPAFVTSKYSHFELYGVESRSFHLKNGYTALIDNKICELTADMFHSNQYRIVDADETASEIIARINKAREAFCEYKKVEAELNEICPLHVSASEPKWFDITR